MRLQDHRFHCNRFWNQFRFARRIIVDLENIRHDIGVLRFAERARRIIRHQTADNVVQIVEGVPAVFPAPPKGFSRQRRRRRALQAHAMTCRAVLLVGLFTTSGLGGGERGILGEGAARQKDGG